MQSPSSSTTEEYRYGAAIDAGSSGSRIYLYRWPVNKLPQHEQLNTSQEFTKVEREAIYTAEVTPGISDEHGIGIALLEELVTLAKEALPSNVDVSHVPIYLGATAGMRIIDSSYEADVLSSIRSILHSSGFYFHNNYARTISGEEEGIYDWLVANYLKNNGDFPTPTTAYGALDLGGASTQISFPISSQTPMGGGDTSVPLRIDNVDYPLYTQSFLYYGVDQALSRYDTKFATETKSNPCYPSGYTDPNSDIAGLSNWEQCLESVEQIFSEQNNSNCTGEGKRCLGIGGMHQLPFAPNQKFIAMSAFVYTWDYLGLNIGPKTEDLDALNARAQRVCNLSHQQQISRYEKHMERWPDKRKTIKPHAQCFNAAFTYHLLSKGYGLPTTNTPIEIYYDIGGTKVQWALGLMLVEANKLGSVFKQNAQLDDIFFFGEMSNTYQYLLAISVAILFGLMAVVRMKKKRWSSPSYCEDDHDEEMCLLCSPRKGR